MLCHQNDAIAGLCSQKKLVEIAATTVCMHIYVHSYTHTHSQGYAYTHSYKIMYTRAKVSHFVFLKPALAFFSGFVHAVYLLLKGQPQQCTFRPCISGEEVRFPRCCPPPVPKEKRVQERKAKHIQDRATNPNKLKKPEGGAQDVNRVFYHNRRVGGAAGVGDSDMERKKKKKREKRHTWQSTK